MILREYDRVANQEHYCDNCHGYIHPGEMYRGTIFLNQRKKTNRIIVNKKHINPFCEDPFEDDILRDLEKERLEELARSEAA